MSASSTPVAPPPSSSRNRGPFWLRRQLSKLSWRWKVAGLLGLLLGLILGLACVVSLAPAVIAGMVGAWLVLALVVLGLMTRLAKSTIVVLLLGVAMNAAYFSYTSYGERNFDVSHQVKYVRYMVEHGTAPPDAYCFICHHPPLFYGTAAVAHQLGRGMGLPEPLRASQVVPFLSVILMGLSATYLTRRFGGSRGAVNLATALMLCWPYTLVMNARIHNDTLASGLMMAGIYACVRWYQDQDAKSLLLAALLCVLSVFTKSNGYVLVILLFCASALVWFRADDKLAFARSKVPILAALVLALGGYAANRGSARQYDKEADEKKEKEEKEKKEKEQKAQEAKDKAAKAGDGAKGAVDKGAVEKGADAKGVAKGVDQAAKAKKQDTEPEMRKLSPEELAKLKEDNKKLSLSERLLGSAGKIGARSWMGNEPFNYLYFDFEGFLKHPYVLARHDGSGRQFFWNHALKSSLFSTHNHRPDYETSYRLNVRLAGVLNGVFLGMLAFMLISLTKIRKEHQLKYAVLVLAGLGFLGGGAAFRILIPHSHHSDFRHMFPVLLPMVVAYALMVDVWRREKMAMHWVGLWLALAMILGTAVYYAPRHDWTMRSMPTYYVFKDAKDVSRYAKAESSWNEYQYVVLEPNQRLWIHFDKPTTGYGFSLATDHNDIYEVRIIGAKETRVMDVGMKKAAGIAIFTEHLVPPVEGVKAVEIRPRAGDVHYSVGHFLLNPYGFNKAYVPPAKTPVPKQLPVQPAPAKKLPVQPAKAVQAPAKSAMQKPAPASKAPSKSGAKPAPASKAPSKPGAKLAPASKASSKPGAKLAPASKASSKPGAKSAPGVKAPSKPGASPAPAEL